MDTTDSKITFNSEGVCDHCIAFEKYVLPNWHTDERGISHIRALVDEIKRAGKGKEFDCILGLSGGLDSSYLLHLVVSEFGLRPLVFHVDGGWNSNIAVNNIQVLVDALGLELYTEVINWKEMQDFQLSFFKSGVPHIDIPQDMAFIATLYQFCNKHGIKYILNGGNYSTECIRNPMEWIYYGTDGAQIKDICRKFGTIPLTTFPMSSILFHKIYLRFIKRLKVVKPLNYLPYTKKIAIETLSQKYGWKEYSQKHFESRFTKFYEGYWLPTRFGFDTRRVQFSSLIVTDQMTRVEALLELEKLPYDKVLIEDEFRYVATKLNISSDKLCEYHEMPLKSYKDYANSEWMFNYGAKLLKIFGVERATKR